MQNRGQEAYGERAKEGEERERDGARGGVRDVQTQRLIIHYNKRAKMMFIKENSAKQKLVLPTHASTRAKSFI